MSVRDLASGMARAGYHVGPVRIDLDDRGKKKPSFPDGAWQSTDYLTQVDDLFKGDPTGLFVDCGRSGIVVVDVDLHDGVDGASALRAAGIDLPETPMSLTTRSGGQHFYYRQPETPVGTHQNVPAPGVDIRGVGGIVFGPTTVVHGPDGPDGVYGRPDRGVRVEDLPVLAPEFVAAILAATVKPPRAESTLTPFSGTLSTHQWAVVQEWYDQDLEAIGQLEDGERHSGLLRLVTRALGRGAQLGLELTDIRQDIVGAYTASGGRDLDDLYEVMRSGLEWAEANPLPVPEDYVDPDSVRFEEAVQAEVSKLRIRREAAKRAAQADDAVDLGRELDFSEPPGGLYGKAWVTGVVPAGETTLVFGERNVGKSFVAIDIGLCVASGQSWHGRQVTKGNVLYLAGEGAIGLPARRRAWVEHHGGEVPEGFHLRDRIVNLNNPASMEAWQKVIVEHDIDLVIIDTLRRAARGRELENPGDVQETVELVDDLRGVRHGCSALVLGHPTKTDPRQPAGAGTLQDALPMIHRLEKDGEGAAAEVHMVTTKAKDGPTGAVATFGMKPVGESLVFVATMGYGR